MRRANIFWGTLFVLAASLLLLKNVGVIGDFFGIFWIIALMFLGFWLVIGAVTRYPKNKGESIFVPIDRETNARIRISHGAGRLEVHSGAASGNILDGVCTPAPMISTRSTDGNIDINVNHPSELWSWFPGEPRNWDISLTKDLPLILKIDGGANTSIINLKDLIVTEINIDTGASTTDITLPENAGHTMVRIDSGASTLRIRIPQNVSAKISTASGLATINIDKRFPNIGRNLFVSPNYDEAKNRAEIIIKTGVATVDVT